MKKFFPVLATLALLATTAAAESLLGAEPVAEDASADAAEPVGGLFGLFRKPPPPPEAAPETVSPKAPEEGTAERREPEPIEPPVGPEETAEPPSPEVAVPSHEEPTPNVAEPAHEGPTPEVAEPGHEEPKPRGSAPEAPSEEAAVPPTKDLDADLQASRRAPANGDVELPTQEIQGEIERPDIFFLLPKARSRSDEQLIRARIRREITRPLIKDWLEEELLLK